MKKIFLIGLSVAALLSMANMTVFAADPIKTQDGLLEIELPAENWYQINSDENTEMFSDGDCAILVNLYKNGDTLPAIQSADANHELIYTAAASTQEYILHVVGYAHAQEDFSGICKAINTIKVDNTKIADSMLNHVVSTEEYGIADMNYTAWVSTDELNVRSTSEDGAIIATLAYGDKVTVTGSVLKNGSEIGWSRIQMADGTEGYVSAQFLSSIAIGTEDTAPEVDQQAEKTSATVKLYIGGEPVYLTVYTDGLLRTDDGDVYWQYMDGVYTNSAGKALYTTPSGGKGSYRTGNVYTVYDEYGTPFTIYEYTDGYCYDDAGNHYKGSPGCDFMYVNDGEWMVWSGDPTLGKTPVETGSEDTLSIAVTNGSGAVKYIAYDYDAGCYTNGEGHQYYRTGPDGTYADEYGTDWYEFPYWNANFGPQVN